MGFNTDRCKVLHQQGKKSQAQIADLGEPVIHHNPQVILVSATAQPGISPSQCGSLANNTKSGLWEYKMYGIVYEM